MKTLYTFISIFFIIFNNTIIHVLNHVKGDCHKWWSCVDGNLSQIETCDDEIPSGGKIEDFNSYT